MDIRKCFPSKWLECADLDGQVHTLTIVRISIEEVGKQKEQRPAVWFDGVSKGLVLNKTNGNTIAAIYGFETDGWIGKQIMIYPTETEFGGKMVSCIRVKSEMLAMTQPAAIVTTTPAIGANIVSQPAAVNRVASELSATTVQPRQDPEPITPEAPPERTTEPDPLPSGNGKPDIAAILGRKD